MDGLHNMLYCELVMMRAAISGKTAGGGQALGPISGEGLQIAIAGGGKLSQVEGATAVRCK